MELKPSYVFDSPVGPIFIVWIPDERRWGTMYDDTVWETCEEPQANADNIFCHVSGVYEWDASPYDAPDSLEEWTRLEPRR